MEKQDKREVVSWKYLVMYFWMHLRSIVANNWLELGWKTMSHYFYFQVSNSHCYCYFIPTNRMRAFQPSIKVCSTINYFFSILVPSLPDYFSRCCTMPFQILIFIRDNHPFHPITLILTFIFDMEWVLLQPANSLLQPAKKVRI